MGNKVIISNTKNYEISEVNLLLKKELEKKGAVVSNDINSGIRFKAGFKSFFRSEPYSNLLGIISSGSIFVEKKGDELEIVYTLNYIFFITYCFLCFILSTVVLTLIPLINVYVGLVFSLFFIIIILPANIIVTLKRFKQFLKEVLST